MMNTNEKKILSVQEQTNVMQAVIAQKQYDSLLQMVQNGYKVTPAVLETLKWSRKTKVLESLIDQNFEYDGDLNYLLTFLNEFLGEKEAAAYICERSAGLRYGNNWCSVFRMLSPQQLVMIKNWKELAKRYCWQELADNGMFDVIINHGVLQKQSVEILSKYKQKERIIELKKFIWLTQFEKGEELLCQLGQFELLYDNYRDLRNWTPREALSKMCQYPGGQRVLYQHKEYAILIEEKQFDLLKSNKKWEILVAYNCFDIVDWKQWHQEEKEKADRPFSANTMDNFYAAAAKAQKWELLAADGQSFLLFKKGKLRWWWKSLFGNQNRMHIVYRDEFWDRLARRLSLRPYDQEEDL